MSKKKLKSRLVLLYIGSFIFSIAPIIIVLAFNWGDYTQEPADTVKLSFGAILAAVLVFLKVIGKLKMPQRIVFFGIVFIMAYLLQPLLEDIILLSGMALLGELIDLVCFQHAIKVTRENILISKTAIETTNQVEAVVKKYFNGRA